MYTDEYDASVTVGIVFICYIAPVSKNVWILAKLNIITETPLCDAGQVMHSWKNMTWLDSFNNIQYSQNLAAYISPSRPGHDM